MAMEFLTKLWKRSAKSFATTIPHIALLDIDENKSHEVIWEYDKRIKRWTIRIVEKKG